MNKLLSIILDIIFIVLIMSLINLNIIPDKYVIILGIGLLLLGLIFTIISFKIKNILGRIIVFILLLIISIVSVIGIYYINTTNEFFSNIREVREKTVYYVFVNKNSNYNKLEDINNKSIGFLNGEALNYNNAISIIKKEIDIKVNNYDDVNSMLKDLYSSKIDSILLNSNNYELLCENISGFDNNTRIIKKISIDLKDDVNKKEVNTKRAFNILISGIDTRGNINRVSRSDVNILVTVDPVNHKILLTSIPRDYYVKLHTYNSYDKLTHAGIYGIDESMGTISDLLNTKIDYYIRVNFDTVVKLVDEIGGVDVYSDTSFRAYNGTYFRRGINHLDGKKALAYSRERKVFSDGDRMRGRHQQQIIEAIINKISTSKSYLVKYKDILDSLNNLIQTNVSSSSIKIFVKDELNTLKKWSVESISLDGNDGSRYTYSMPGWLLYVMIPNINTVNEASIKINNYLNEK